LQKAKVSSEGCAAFSKTDSKEKESANLLPFAF
jgi:hypothetical protein